MKLQTTACHRDQRAGKTIALLLLVCACSSQQTKPRDAGGSVTKDASGDESRDANPSISFLTSHGRNIADESDNTIVLKGVNLGGIWEWESWIWGGPLSVNATGSTTDIQAHFATVLGQSGTEAFTQRVYSEMLQEADVARIAGLGFNVVRVPLSRRVFEDPVNPGQFLTSGWQTLDQLLAWCEAHRVYAILDLHSAPGGQSSLFMADPESISLWNSTDAQNRTVALWEALSARYANRAIVAGYDILNEPDPPNGSALHDLDLTIAQAIRRADSRHLIFIEGAHSATDFSMFPAPLDPNMVYSFHDYSAGAKLTSTVAAYQLLSETQNIPIWCGEFGGDLGQDTATAVRAFATAQAAGWAMWSWKMWGNQSWHLESVTRASPNWSIVLAWQKAGWTGPAPSAKQLNDGIDELFTAFALTACSESTAVAAAVGGP
jgi:endoglucanase